MKKLNSILSKIKKTNIKISVSSWTRAIYVMQAIRIMKGDKEIRTQLGAISKSDRNKYISQLTLSKRLSAALNKIGCDMSVRTIRTDIQGMLFVEANCPRAVNNIQYSIIMMLMAIRLTTKQRSSIINDILDGKLKNTRKAVAAYINKLFPAGKIPGCTRTMIENMTTDAMLNKICSALVKSNESRGALWATMEIKIFGTEGLVVPAKIIKGYLDIKIPQNDPLGILA